MKMMLRRPLLVALSLLCLTFGSPLGGLTEASMPTLYTTRGGEATAALSAAVLSDKGESVPCGATLLSFPTVRPAEEKGGSLYPAALLPGGMPFGIRLETRGLLVVGLGEVVSGGKKLRPAHDAGLRARDVLLAAGGQAVSSTEELSSRVAASGGKPITLTVERGGEQLSFTVTPVRADADGRYACGLLVRDHASGIGTVTFIDPESGLFGGLGHGVCDSDTGALMPLARGNVLGVRIRDVIRGEVGRPGELCGSFTSTRLGVLAQNNECGVFGALTRLPDMTDAKEIPTARAEEVVTGPATVRCTLGDDGVREYAIDITAIDKSARPTKSFTIRVTDPELLARTGGIVQGMSGSPIIQNGKLIGAVTHVLVDDPTAGYGIFLENMLSHMKMRAAA